MCGILSAVYTYLGPVGITEGKDPLSKLLALPYRTHLKPVIPIIRRKPYVAIRCRGYINGSIITGGFFIQLHIRNIHIQGCIYYNI